MGLPYHLFCIRREDNERIGERQREEENNSPQQYAIEHIGIYFNHIGKFENELTQLAEPAEQEILKSNGSMTVSKRGSIGQGKKAQAAAPAQ